MKVTAIKLITAKTIVNCSIGIFNKIIILSIINEPMNITNTIKNVNVIFTNSIIIELFELLNIITIMTENDNTKNMETI